MGNAASRPPPYQRLREEARASAERARELAEDSRAAYERGQRALAKELLDERKYYKELSERCDREASKLIFAARNDGSHLRSATLDMRGLLVHEALERVADRLKQARARNEVEFWVITGGENRAGGMPRVRPAVKAWAARRNIDPPSSSCGTQSARHTNHIAPSGHPCHVSMAPCCIEVNQWGLDPPGYTGQRARSSACVSSIAHLPPPYTRLHPPGSVLLWNMMMTGAPPSTSALCRCLLSPLTTTSVIIFSLPFAPALLPSTPPGSVLPWDMRAPPSASVPERCRLSPLTMTPVIVPSLSFAPTLPLSPPPGSVLLWDMRAPPSACVPWSCRLSPLTTTTAPTSPLAVTGLVFSYGGLHVTAADSTGGLRVLEVRL
ncbi:unnamed protein product [Closterium sp. Yama58-4]|nr:unnamed protein product [Closterium sp. Yama58-4]